MNFSSLFSLDYYLNPAPVGDFLFGYALLIFFVALFFMKTIYKAVGPKNKFFLKSLRKKFWIFPILSTVGIILVLARFSMVPYFSMRLLLFVVLALIFVLGLVTKLKIVKEYNHRRRSYERETGKTFAFFAQD
jgi:hypothetical protein